MRNYHDNIKEIESVEYMNSLTVPQLSLAVIPTTIQNAFIDGSYSMDKKWRKAFHEYCDKNGLEFSKEFPKLLYILNNPSNN